MEGRFRQWFACITSTITVAISGLCFAWTAPLLVKLVGPSSPVPMTPKESSLVSSFISAGTFFMTVPSGFLADRYGRKSLLRTSPLLVLFSWVLALTTRSVTVLCLIRFIQGASVAITLTVAPLYLVEIAEPRIRGLLSGQCQSMFYLGCLYAYVSGPYLTYDNYVYVCAFLPILSTILLFFVPESPYFLFMIGKETEAMESLKWLRGDENVLEEYISIKTFVDQDMRREGFRDLFSKRHIKSFLIIEYVCVIKYSGGMAAILVFASRTFSEELHFWGNDEMTIMFGFVLYLTTFFSSFIADKTGRKPLLILSSAGASIFNFIIGLIYYLDGKIDVGTYKWLSYASLIGFSVIMNVGIGPLMYTLQAEYFPSHTRGIAGGITEMIAAASVFISINQYQFISEAFGNYMNHFIFCFVALIATITFPFFITETAGKSLGQIQNVLNQGKTEQQ